jgi:methylmalonyl-CoA/ethylmalonyl-CoA epimerase
VKYAVFGPDATFHHVGLAVESIRTLAPSADVVHETTQRVSLAFVDFNGIRVELLEPDAEGSPVALGLRRGQKLLHLCFEVTDLEAAIARCRASGFHRLGPPVTTPVFGGRRLVWVYSRQFGLFELVERTRTEDSDEDRKHQAKH